MSWVASARFTASTFMATNDELRKLVEQVSQKYGDRSGWLFNVLHTLALSGQPCDVCTYSGVRHLDVTVDPHFVYALMYGAGPAKLAEMLAHVKLRAHGSPDSTVAFNDIWIINPMPKDGFTEQQLRDVDLAEAERQAGPNGETIREMIRNTYRPKDDTELDRFVRRFLAS